MTVPEPENPPERLSGFPVTRWSLVVAARDDAPPQDRQDAIARLCEIYWQPLYVYSRRSGHDSGQAEDLTQGFLARLVEKDRFGAADPARGKMRSYLLTAFKNYIRNELAKSPRLQAGR